MPIKGKPRLIMQRIKREKTRNLIKKMDKIKKKLKKSNTEEGISSYGVFGPAHETSDYVYVDWKYCKWESYYD